MCFNLEREGRHFSCLKRLIKIWIICSWKLESLCRLPTKLSCQSGSKSCWSLWLVGEKVLFLHSMPYFCLTNLLFLSPAASYLQRWALCINQWLMSKYLWSRWKCQREVKAVLWIMNLRIYQYIYVIYIIYMKVMVKCWFNSTINTINWRIS